MAALREQRVPPMTTQVQQRRAASQDRQQFASANHGRPAMVAAAKPVPEGKPIAAVFQLAPLARLLPRQPQ